jgi:hypothetical protein
MRSANESLQERNGETHGGEVARGTAKEVKEVKDGRAKARVAT